MTEQNAEKQRAIQPSFSFSTIDVSFALSLIGGTLITAGSIIGMGLGAIGRPFFWGMGGMMGATG
jgi:hypothetical protein